MRSRRLVPFALAAALAPAAMAQDLAVGAPAPTFELRDLDGELHRLDRGLDRGPLVLVFFRGAW